MDRDGSVNWNDFYKKFNLRSIFACLLLFSHSELNKRILDRSRQRLIQIRNDIYSYMIAPKDAFR